MKTMPLPLLRLCLISGLAFSLLPASTNGADITWNGTTSGDWTVGSNWIGGVAPGNDTTTDNAYFTGNGEYTISLGGNRSVRRIYISGNANPIFNLSSSTLSTGALFINGGSASLTGGTISGAWYHGYRVSNTSFSIDGSTAVGLTNGGNIGYTDSTTSANFNTLNIRNGGTFTSASGGFILARADDSGTNLTANNNKVEVTGTNSSFTTTSLNIGTISAGAVYSGRQSNNNSLVINNGGAATTSALYLGRVEGTGTASGNTITVGGTSTGSQLNLRSTASMLPSGIGSYTMHIGFASTGLTGATANVATVNAGGAINMNGGSVRVYSGSGNALRIYGGSYNGGETGGLLVEGKLFLGAGGSMTAKQIEVSAAGRFGDKSDNANAGFTSGVLNLETMIYRPTATFSVGDNAGSSIATYNMVGSSTHSFAQGIIIEELDGRLAGNGTIQGLSGANTTLTVNGKLAPGHSVGTINLVGDLISGANAVFDFEIAAGASFDQLLITGDAAFAGTLNLSILGAYTPQVGDSFKLFDFNTAIGSFSTLNLAALDNGATWDTSELYTTGEISVIPEPSTVYLMLISGVGLTGLLRRRFI